MAEVAQWLEWHSGRMSGTVAEADLQALLSRALWSHELDACLRDQTVRRRAEWAEAAGSGPGQGDSNMRNRRPETGSAPSGGSELLMAGAPPWLSLDDRWAPRGPRATFKFDPPQQSLSSTAAVWS